MGALTLREQAVERTAYKRGAEAMRSALANWLMCGCEWKDRQAVASAAMAHGQNSAARWRACHRSDCLMLLSMEALEVPIPEDAQ